MVIGQKLVIEGVMHKKSFQWQSQLKQRYENGDAKLAIADVSTLVIGCYAMHKSHYTRSFSMYFQARFDYKFEYLGVLCAIFNVFFPLIITFLCSR